MTIEIGAPDNLFTIGPEPNMDLHHTINIIKRSQDGMNDFLDVDDVQQVMEYLFGMTNNNVTPEQFIMASYRALQAFNYQADEIPQPNIKDVKAGNMIFKVAHTLKRIVDRSGETDLNIPRNTLINLLWYEDDYVIAATDGPEPNIIPLLPHEYDELPGKRSYATAEYLEKLGFAVNEQGDIIGFF